MADVQKSCYVHQPMINEHEQVISTAQVCASQVSIFHPLIVPKTGNWAGANRDVTIPSAWNGPIVLRFYCADNYFASNENRPGQIGTESFFEHRYKQVLINDKVVWERDVIDDNRTGSPTAFEIDITNYITTNKPFKLTFRVFDKTSTLERNSKDVWFIGGAWYTPGDGKTEREPKFHIVDVDCAHIPQDDPDWKTVDGMVATLLTPDHSQHNRRDGWPAFQLGEQFILHYWMTGDIDSLDAAMANADYLIRNNYPGLGSTSMRNSARPMLTLLRVWQATGDRRYRVAAEKYFDPKFCKEKMLDWRRGTFISPLYQNWRVVESGLGSMYAHNVYDYYRLTGDAEAAQMIVAIADSIYAESMLPQEASVGDILHYVRYGRV